uniref:efflux transporter outer membrane subunit n=1 Tax=Thaumasiovibrio occultus TaxID=1891184 RepID=UPI000B35FE65|nr:efflux transporter outer membrane subunit [Thaumasiovibrio occultus]
MTRLFARTQLGSALVITSLLSGCVNFIPTYSRPALPVEDQWPQIHASQNSLADPATIASVSDWREFVTDEKLAELIELALANNRDLREALYNVVRAEAQLGLQRSTRYPDILIQGGSQNQRISENSNNGNSAISRQQSLNVGFNNYEIDFWGRIYSLEQQALENYLATVEGRRNVQISLIANVIQAYLTLESDLRLLALAQETFDSQQASLRLTNISFENGVSSGLDLAQAQTTVATAKVDVARFTSQVNVDINALKTLVGSPFSDALLPSGDAPIAFPALAADLPSAVLINRPDVLQAEYQLAAANANIGAARAAYFPTIALTTTGGLASTDFDDLFSGSSRAWSFIPTISLPIFDGGERGRSLDIAVTDQKLALNNYERTIQTAFQEVADALINQATFDDQIAGQKMLVDAYQESFRLSELRFREGVDDYFNVLDSQRSYYTAQQTLISTELNAQLNIVTLYKALGAGWVETDVPVPLTSDMYSGIEGLEDKTEE